MPQALYNVASSDVRKAIDSLIFQMVHIKDESGEFLLKLEDGRVIDTKGWQGWEWTHGVGLYGLWKDHCLTGSPESLEIIEKWFQNRFDEGGTTKNINTVAAMLTLAYVYEEKRVNKFLPWLENWAEWAMYELPRTKYGGMSHMTYNSTNAQELWDDTLMMTVLPLAKIGKVLNRPHYVEEAKRQFLLHIKYLFDTKTGLFFHGWTFADGGHNFCKGICRALVQYQEDDGLWRTLLDQPADAGSYVESSATAGFAYGILKALRMRYIVGEEYQNCAIKAIKAVLGKVNDQGELLDVSFGTAMGHTLQHYIDIDRTSMPYGQAMAIMALGEFSRVFI
ncbi:glycosyl Hydrolase Family 88 [Botrytis cinerea]